MTSIPASNLTPAFTHMPSTGCGQVDHWSFRRQADGAGQQRADADSEQPNAMILDNQLPILHGRMAQRLTVYAAVDADAVDAVQLYQAKGSGITSPRQRQRDDAGRPCRDRSPGSPRRRYIAAATALRGSARGDEVTVAGKRRQAYRRQGDADARLNEAVTVSGKPTLRLNDGSTPLCRWLRAKTLTFRTTVAST